MESQVECMQLSLPTRINTSARPTPNFPDQLDQCSAIPFQHIYLLYLLPTRSVVSEGCLDRWWVKAALIGGG